MNFRISDKNRSGWIVFVPRHGDVLAGRPPAARCVDEALPLSDAKEAGLNQCE